MTTAEVVKYPMFDVVRLDVDPRYKAIQEKGLIKVQLPYGDPCWLATRYEDVKTVFGHPQMSRALGVTKNAPGMFPASPGLKDPSLMLNQDPPEHTRLRRLASPSFTVSRVALLQPFIQSVVDELLDQMSAKGPGADFVEMYSNLLPVRTLAHILGIPKDKAFEFKACVDISSSLGSPAEERQAAQAKLLGFIEGLLAERRAERSDNLLGELVEARDAGDRLSESELTLLALALWHGGFKTTLWQLGTTLYTLMTHRDHWQELLEKPDLLPPAMEELWRWVPSFKYGVPFCRWAKADIEYSDGTVVRAGEPVLGEFAVGNRDESVYPDASRLDFHRVDPAAHLAFTYGPHTCIGQHLARLQIRLTLQALLQRYPNLQLAAPEQDIEFSTTSFMRSVEALPLKW
jgi:cytochrome P450